MTTPEQRPLSEEEFWHEERRTCAGCAAAITFDADCQHWWIPYGYGNPPPGTFTCPDGTRHRPTDTAPVARADAVFTYLLTHTARERVAEALWRLDGYDHRPGDPGVLAEYHARADAAAGALRLAHCARCGETGEDRPRPDADLVVCTSS